MGQSYQGLVWLQSPTEMVISRTYPLPLSIHFPHIFIVASKTHFLMKCARGVCLSLKVCKQLSPKVCKLHYLCHLLNPYLSISCVNLFEGVAVFLFLFIYLYPSLNIHLYICVHLYISFCYTVSVWYPN